MSEFGQVYLNFSPATQDAKHAEPEDAPGSVTEHRTLARTA
jgi:hypothetical protein